MKAVDRFQPSRGLRFSTYATWWIRQSVSRGVADYGRTIRLPVHAVEAIGKLERARRTLREASGREPSEAELGARLGMPADKVRLLLDAARQPYSLDAPTGENEEQAIGTMIRDRTVPSPGGRGHFTRTRIPHRGCAGTAHRTGARGRAPAVRVRRGPRVHAGRSRPQAGPVARARAADRSAAPSRSFGAVRPPEHSYCSSADGPYSPGTGTLFRRRYTPSCPRW